jgi:hypothetical protein
LDTERHRRTVHLVLCSGCNEALQKAVTYQKTTPAAEEQFEVHQDRNVFEPVLADSCETVELDEDSSRTASFALKTVVEADER